MPKDKNKTKKELTEELKKTVVSRTIEYIIIAFGLVAGLAWNEAIKGLIDYLFPVTANSVLAKFIYAIIITVMVVVISIYLIRVFNKKDAGNK